MANIQQYELQLQKLEELLSFLKSWEEEMSLKSLEYEKTAYLLRDNGLPLETYNKLVDSHYSEVRRIIGEIMVYIDGETEPFIRANIANLERLRDMNR